MKVWAEGEVFMGRKEQYDLALKIAKFTANWSLKPSAGKQTLKIK